MTERERYDKVELEKEKYYFRIVVKLIIAFVIVFGLMIYISLSSCAAFKPLTIYVTSEHSSDTSKN